MRPAGMRSVVVCAALSACSSSCSAAAPQRGSPDASVVQVDTLRCSGDPSTCLSGTARLSSGFAAPPTTPMAQLFRGFPSRGSPLDGGSPTRQIVATDKTWAFSSLETWAHYYLQFEPGFLIEAGVVASPVTRIGPLTVPSDGAPIDVKVKPAQLDVYETSSAGMPATVQTATARLSEATPGCSSVSIRIGSTDTMMSYDSGTHSYAVTFGTPPAAQPMYQITGLPASGAPSQPSQWSLVADPPTFTGTITSPSSGATVPASHSIQVTWGLEPADYVMVELFVRTGGSWANVYTSSAPIAPDVSSETIPAGAVTAAGSYLLNVSFAKANCPVTADGCVHSSTVANQLLTVQ